MKNRLIALVLAIALVCALLPTTLLTASAEVFSGTCGAEGDGGNLTWTLDTSTWVLTISGLGAMKSYWWVLGTTDSTAPWNSYQDDIRTVVVNNGVTNIGTCAFLNCIELSSVRIPDSVKTIGDYAFCGTSLTNVTIPSGVTYIGEGAFYGCTGLTSVTIPGRVKEIGSEAFCGCTGLTSVAIGNGVTSIGDSAFSNCSGLTSVTIPKSVRDIEYYAFCSCSALIYVYYAGSESDWGRINISFGNEDLTNATIRYNVTEPTVIVTPSDIPTEPTIIPSGDTFTVADSIAVGDKIVFVAAHNGTNYAMTNSTAVSNALGAVEVAVNGDTVDVALKRTLGSEAVWEVCAGSAAGTFCLKSCDGKYISWGGSGTRLFLIDAGYDLNVACGKGASKLLVESDRGISFRNNVGVPQFRAYKDSNNSGEYSWDLTIYKLGNGSVTPTEPTTPPTEPTTEPTEPLAFQDPLIKNNCTFSYYSEITGDKERDASYQFDYNENVFQRSSESYSQALARMSICFAMAANKTRATNICSLYDSLGFSYVNNYHADGERTSDSIYYPTPTMNTIGYAIGSKQVAFADGDYTLIVVTVRGGGYKEEWADNFRVGSNREHQGFSEAAEKVVNGIKNYISTQRIKGKVKIWLTGYSRAAATANIAAYHLNQYALSGEFPGLSKDSIYAYCFECPQTVIGTNGGTAANNIFSIVNPIDFVPMVPSYVWGYSRYGITKHLPAAETLNNNYARFCSLMKGKYTEIMRSAGVTEQTIQKNLPYVTTSIPAQGSFFKQFVAELSLRLGSNAFGIDGVRNYERDSQAGLIAAGKRLGAEEWLSLIYSTKEYIPKDFVTSHSFDLYKIAYWVTKTGKRVPACAHYPELCLAWMMALDVKDTKAPVDNGSDVVDGLSDELTVRLLHFSGDATVSIYDDSDALVAQSIRGEIQEIEDSTIGAYIDANGQLIVALPLDGSFRTEIVPAEDGTATYQVEEIDFDTWTPTRLVSYEEIEVEAGETISGTIDAQEEEASSYPLHIGEEELQPTADVDEVAQYFIDVTVEGQGTVSGGGLVNQGEAVKLTAEADEGNAFAGWYIEGSLICEAAEYAFTASGDTRITAKFSENAQHEHDYEAEITPPTCTEQGYTTHTCVCGDSYVDSYVPALGHAIVVDAAVPATCTSTGLTAGEHCTRCDYRVAQESVAALGHSIISHDAKAATCTENGWNDYQTCTRCDYSTYAEIAALGHDIVVDAAVPATCTATGLTAGEHCTRCDYKKAQETVPLIAHSYKNGVCSVCGAKDPNYKPAEPTKFNDVKENAWYYDAVNYAVQNGLMNGVGNGNFAPDSPMTRAMLVTVLWRYEGGPQEGRNIFTDVPGGQWYTDAVAWAAHNGIVGGVGNNKFDPNGNITREQMAAILFRYANKKGFDTSKRGNLSGFPDRSKGSAYATDAIAWTVAEGIIGGSDGKLLPQGNATRAQVATILMRFIENIAHAK